ncbi:hypothetical protein LP420_26515 [Massilia sp. B-10]|nr:hypothetical protein LP420_26515 [Massilia sp. B-10]
MSANFRLVLGSREFWTYALPGALSYGSIFAFISGSSPVLIRILQVPTSMFGFCFAFGVSGYMSGTILCRHLLPKFGQAITLRIGTTMSSRSWRPVPDRRRLRRRPLVAGGRRDVPDDAGARRQFPGLAGLARSRPSPSRLTPPLA